MYIRLFIKIDDNRLTSELLSEAIELSKEEKFFFTRKGINHYHTFLLGGLTPKNTLSEAKDIQLHASLSCYFDKDFIETSADALLGNKEIEPPKNMPSLTKVLIDLQKSIKRIEDEEEDIKVLDSSKKFFLDTSRRDDMDTNDDIL